jgi:hypothetical protein
METLTAMYDMFFRSYSQKGEVFILNHLQSEKGKAMNGRRCRVVGCDSPNQSDPLGRRIHVRLLNPDTLQLEGKVLQIKPRSLIQPNNYCSVPSRASMPPQETLRRLKLAMKHAKQQGYHRIQGADFRDRGFRCRFLKNYLPDRLPPPSKCMDTMIPPEEINMFEKVKDACVPGCSGDGQVDFARFGEGLIGTTDECPICQEPLLAQSLRLPCNHMFHVQCAKSWLEEHNTCPTCRGELINPWKTYVFADIYKQIQRRIEEWFLSGMCERCQAAYQENDPVVEVELANGGKKVVMPLSEANRRGETRYERIQGESMEKINILQR